MTRFIATTLNYIGSLRWLNPTTLRLVAHDLSVRKYATLTASIGVSLCVVLLENTHRLAGDAKPKRITTL